jgi:hypothetical protein
MYSQDSSCSVRATPNRRRDRALRCPRPRTSGRTKHAKNDGDGGFVPRLNGAGTALRAVPILAWFSAIWFLALSASAANAPKLTPVQTEFFESKIRPLLVENCYKCHSAGAEKLKGGLLLDTRDGVLKGGDTGPAIVPGKPDDSLLIKAVRYADKDLQMPPSDKKLPDNLIASLEQWVRMGAPDPRTEGTNAKPMYSADIEKAKKHWAYKPVVKPAVPQPDDPQKWIQNPIDNFILAGLRSKDLAPSPKADKITLIRRATFDLHGLPPTEKEVEDFLADSSPNSFATVLDRLLASARYGERWGRHWLDLAKYADTKGPPNQGRDNRYLWSWTYRDWVIRAFNEDLPYDQFILRQIAADKLNLDNKRDLAAMGYLTLGNRFNNNLNDFIDDRIDLIGKSTMGLTLGCARCHDHKFDPIPTRDYYSLHGVFNSSVEPREGPVIVPPKDAGVYRDFQTLLAAREAALLKFYDEAERELSADLRGKVGDYLLALREHKKSDSEMPLDTYVRRRGLSGRVALAWNEYLKNKSRKHSPVFAPWFAFEKIPNAEFIAKSKELSAKFYANADRTKPINPAVAKLFVTPPASLAQVAARYTALFANVTKAWESTMSSYESRKKTSTTPPPEPIALPDASLEELRQVLYAKGSPTFIDERLVRSAVDRDNRLRDRQNALQRAVNDVKATHPGSPVHAHVMEDADKPRDSYVMVKGNPGHRGPVVPRQFPEIMAGSTRRPFKDGSGRLELAQAIVNKDNSLTARVMANRIWLHHFGDGLVNTPDDFGVRSEPPIHPDLLDWLAAEFMGVETLKSSSVEAAGAATSGSASTVQRFNASTSQPWSLKKMHRLIMLSATYQQSSEENPRFAQIDPGNKYYWQMNRRRLDFEALRDTILYIGGRLDLAMGGPGVRLDAEPYSTRRTVYAFIDRARVPSMFQSFDFANPDLTTGKRSETIIPQQALFMMNSPLVVEQARNLTLRTDFKAKAKAEEKIKLLYKLIYQRAPTDVEMKLALDYIRGESAVTAANAGQLAWEYGYGEFNPVEKRVEDFVQLATFNGRAWVLGNRQNATRIGNVMLTANGGQPGNGIQHGAIRRWTARRDGFISIDGMLVQQSKTPAETVRGWIVSSGTGLLGSYSAQQSQMPTRLPRVLVKRGDTIDFVVAGKGPFNWAPTVRFLEGTKSGEPNEWNAEKDFSGMVAPKHLEPWEKLAQVLLETNEMTFVN